MCMPLAYVDTIKGHRLSKSIASKFVISRDIVFNEDSLLKRTAVD